MADGRAANIFDKVNLVMVPSVLSYDVFSPILHLLRTYLIRSVPSFFDTVRPPNESVILLYDKH